MAEDFPKLLKNIHPQTQNTKTILRHISVKLLKTKDKKKILKSTREEITLN